MIRPAHLRFAALLSSLLMAALGAAPAAAAPRLGAHGGRAGSPAAQVSILITSLSRTIARPGSKVVVSGTVINPTATPVSGPLTVHLWSSGTPFASSGGMRSYLNAQGGTGVDTLIPGAVTSLPALAAHTSHHWSVTLPVSHAGMHAFGVYPLAAQLDQSGIQLAAARTFLPFWPAKSHTHSVKPLRIAWIWPLIATPQRTACPALLSDNLAGQVAKDGRLERLLAAGQSATAARAHLTWAIDPALLADVRTMTSPYRVGPVTCAGGTSRPASAAASAWLTQVKSVSAHQDFFITAYGDADVAALAHGKGLDKELTAAFTDARGTARQILSRTQRTASAGSAPHLRPGDGIAWPADGEADYGVLEALAANGIGTVVLNSTVMPAAGPVKYTPTAVTTTPDGLGTQLRVLLADDGLTRILSLAPDEIPGTVPAIGSGKSAEPRTGGPAAVGQQAATFGREQWFLAETALIAAQAPHTARAVVVAPPRRWDPASGLPASLLGQTTSAPWLRPVELSSLTAGHSPKVARQRPPQHQVSPVELKKGLLRQVRSLAGLLRLQGSIMDPPEPGYLSTAVAALESSAWRGTRADQRHAQTLIRQTKTYISRQFQQIKVVEPPRVTLTGKSGAIPVTISNHLNRRITVGLSVSLPDSGGITIGSVPRLVHVAAGTRRTVKIPVNASKAGSTTLRLRLTAPAGAPLPGPATSLTVEATDFGTLAIEIIGVAVLVFVVTAAGRAIRRGRRQDPRTGAGHPVTAGEPDHQTGAARDLPGQGGHTATVGLERTDNAHSPEESDDHATTQGATGPPRGR